MVTFKLAQWWEPGAPDNPLAGTLFRDSAGTFRLSLDGHFGPSADHSDSADTTEMRVSPPMDDLPLLLGETSEGKLITLIDCRVLKASGIPGLTKTSEEIKPQLIAYDVHFASLDEFRLKSLSVRYTNLDQWVATSGFTTEFPQSHPYAVSVHYVMPEPITASLSNGLTVGVHFAASGPTVGSSRSEIHIQQRAWIKVGASDERPYRELIGTITMVADLIALGIGQPMRPIESRASALGSESIDAPQRSVFFDLHHNAEPIAPELADVDATRMLFSMNDIRSNFGPILQAWFSQREKIRPLYSLYFGTLRSPGMYVEHRFLNMFQALEAFDRRDHVDSPEKVQRHEQRLSRILNAVEGEDDRTWLQRRLRYDNKPAVDRLRRLIKKFKAAWIFDDVQQETQLAGNLRNFYTHYDLTLEAKLPALEERPRAMHNLAARLQTLCEVTLLCEVGFAHDEISRRMHETNRLRRRLIQ